MAKSFVRLISRLRVGVFVLCLSCRARLQRLKDTPREIPQKKALLIGICGTEPAPKNRPGPIEGQLKGPHKDVTGMRDVLIDLYDYACSDITMLLDAPLYTKPTKENILKAIDDLVQDARAGDRFVFCFAGHSDQVDTKNPEEEDGMDEYIVCSDGKWIKDDILHDRLVKPLPSKCTLRAVIDACHSGSLLDLDHYTCNRIYVPWISKGGERREKTLWYKTVKQNAMLIPAKKNTLVDTPNFPSISSVMTKSASSLTQSGTHKQTNLCILTTNLINSVDPESHFVLSPRAFCNGFDCFKSNFKDSPLRADVLCLSSSQDAQKTWENRDGKSMIYFLIELLRKNREPTLKDMMTHVSYGIYSMYLELHSDARAYKKAKAAWRAKQALKVQSSSKPTPNAPAPQGEPRGVNMPERPRPPPKKTKTLDLELVNFQDPELSSHFPISQEGLALRHWDM